VEKQTFDSFYQAIFGDRWTSLKEALLAEEQKDRVDFFGKTYFMDRGSVLAAEALEVKQGERVLDLCAAPGGKALLIIQQLKKTDLGDAEDSFLSRPRDKKDTGAAGPKSPIVINERSRIRRARLQKVLQEYLPSEIFSQVRITGHDATQWCLHEKEAYDKILLDAPCSSERHVLQSAKAMKEWSSSRTKRLAAQQYAMLASALQVVKPGGWIVYSTCSISPLENDGVVERLIERKGDFVRILRPDFPIGEETKQGWWILPDITGWGPTYTAVLEKKPLKKQLVDAGSPHKVSDTLRGGVPVKCPILYNEFLDTTFLAEAEEKSRGGDE